ncbi:glycosyltransferase family 2 protein [Patescibacteria group bacterium]|nr:glycosyltransferase family 2 protein [Patescibacteria group bacterium]
MKKVGVILINFKDYANRFLPDCRESLISQSYPAEMTRVYIVDNASTEESRKFLKETFSSAAVIPRADGNYSAGNNAGIKKAAEEGCELFVIANMDVVYDKDWLRELVSAVESDEEIGIAQSKILLFPKNNEEKKDPLINTLGNVIHFLGFGYTSGYGKKNSEAAIDKIKKISGYASGCSLIVKKEVLDKIGNYNEEYYMYHDDVELCSRAKLAGYEIALAPASVIFHKYEFSRSVRMAYFMERNRYVAVFSFYAIPTLFLIMPALACMEFGLLGYSLKNGLLGQKFKVYRYFLLKKTWLQIHETRKQINKYRKLPEKEFVSEYSGKILFQEIDNFILRYFVNPIFNAYWQVVKKIIYW